MLRQLVGAQGEAGDEGPTAAAAALDGPEAARVDGGVHGAYRAIRGEHVGLEESRGGRAEALGEAAEATALNEARDPHRGAPAPLHITARPGGDGVVQIDPHGARL